MALIMTYDGYYEVAIDGHAGTNWLESKSNWCVQNNITYVTLGWIRKDGGWKYMIYFRNKEDYTLFLLRWYP